MTQNAPTTSHPPTTAIPVCLEDPTGVKYRGNLSQTINGHTCQAWTSQDPHQHTRTPANYPNAGLDENYCRNPDNEDTAWCYTTNPEIRWKYCAVGYLDPRCQDYESTTQPPETTTAPPGSTTQPPETTTAPPGSTTQPPETTTSPPGSTTQPPETTTAPPGSTTQPLETTTAPPGTTTQHLETTTIQEPTSSHPPTTGNHRLPRKEKLNGLIRPNPQTLQGPVLVQRPPLQQQAHRQWVYTPISYQPPDDNPSVLHDKEDDVITAAGIARYFKEATKNYERMI
eukprot:XP_011673896.1 PREDICTED: hepatocyte growth factor-like protein [Strongylocentrotus purpuratus]